MGQIAGLKPWFFIMQSVCFVKFRQLAVSRRQARKNRPNKNNFLQKSPP
jgi:hypothetical protein